MNPNEQPPRYDLEKARAEADEMKKMKDTGEAKDYKEAGEKIEQREKNEIEIQNSYNKLFKPVSEVIPGINTEGLMEENIDGIKWEKAENLKNKCSRLEDIFLIV